MYKGVTLRLEQDVAVHKGEVKHAHLKFSWVEMIVEAVIFYQISCKNF
jgi:hypothetical protein